MSITIISTGQELITGSTVDTNSAFLASRLREEGFTVSEMLTIGDDPGLLAREILRVAEHSSAALVSGGLGPTGDDRTRDAMIQLCGKELVLNEEALGHISERMSHGRKLTEGHCSQAKFPPGSLLFPNPVGTAWGFSVKVGKAEVIAMPGVPAEMKAMFTESVLPFLVEKLRPESNSASASVSLFGTPESEVQARLGHLLQEGRNPMVNTSVSDGAIRISLHAIADDIAEAQRLIADDLSAIKQAFPTSAFGEAQSTLASALSALLEKCDFTIAMAESCTGGLIGDMLTDVPGISRFFIADVVAYSNETKIRELGVPKEEIEKFGAVSEQVAKSMAEGVSKLTGADVALSTTGIAGPTGGTPEKPVGLVFVGCRVGDETQVHRLNLRGDRRTIKIRASTYALNMARLALLQKSS